MFWKLYCTWSASSRLANWYSTSACYLQYLLWTYNVIGLGATILDHERDLTTKKSKYIKIPSLKVVLKPATSWSNIVNSKISIWNHPGFLQPFDHPPKKGRCKFRDSCCNVREASNDRVTRWRRNGGTAALEASSYLSPKIPRSEADQLRKQTAPYLLSVVFRKLPQDFKRLFKAIPFRHNDKGCLVPWIRTY